MNSEQETNTPETVEAVEAFPSTDLLLRLYRFGAIFAFILGLSADPNSPAGQGCIIIAFFFALIGVWIFALSNFDLEEPPAE